MIETLETVACDPMGALENCPFCGAAPYWLGVVRAGSIEPHFYHPGVATDKDCVLSGRGFGLDEVGAWNTRCPPEEAADIDEIERQIALQAELFDDVGLRVTEAAKSFARQVALSTIEAHQSLSAQQQSGASQPLTTDIERVALAIERADREKGYDYDDLDINHDEISDWGIDLARAAIQALSPDEEIRLENEQLRNALEAIKELADADETFLCWKTANDALEALSTREGG